ncbi:Adenosine deaminase domain [Dillenia turbinata]|uniref:Adenosine deaminase domain n=1 Tax=Dillenia turbinata TaxID=194707 RepID=A0AAN8VDK0_9MAGN
MEMEWWTLVPKIELHAHLNGSIRDSTLLELARNLGDKGIVIEDFAAENVVYLELRTTPKRNDSIGMTKRGYMEAVLEGLKAVTAVDVHFVSSGFGTENSIINPDIHNTCGGIIRKKIYVGLLLSVHRRDTTATAMDTVQLALEMRNLGVVGIDLSGNPVVGEWATFLPALKYAREHGLRLTLHCGEVPNHEEVQAMLDFCPERIGHACCFEEDSWRKLKSSRIPVEICLTSNIVTETIPNIDKHHFADLYKHKHPMVLCTDDKGVFSTSLTREYTLAASSFGLGEKEIFELARDAIEFIFADDGVKSQLRMIFDSAAKKLEL